mmetsp:Transcript_8300/g.4453  ORF Transcript_8300/g.4453 Transcript_8300/m.4453 type:complete len:105 (-) Transcript_8300:387-701(-)
MTKDKKQLEVADIFRRFGQEYRQRNFLSSEQYKTMRHIEICRTAELGGHVEACDHCGFEHNAYNSWPGQALSKMPDTCKRTMAQRQESGTATVSVFPQRFYAAA